MSFGPPANYLTNEEANFTPASYEDTGEERGEESGEENMEENCELPTAEKVFSLVLMYGKAMGMNDHQKRKIYGLFGRLTTLELQVQFIDRLKIHYDEMYRRKRMERLEQMKRAAAKKHNE